MLGRHWATPAGTSAGYSRSSNKRRTSPCRKITRCFPPAARSLPTRALKGLSSCVVFHLWIATNAHYACQVSMNLWYSTLVSKFLDAVNKLGFPINPDPDGGVDAGVENIARSVNNADGTRQYSAVTYLRQAQNRSNLHVLTGAQVTKIAFDSNSPQNVVAKGVQFVANGQTHTVSVRKDVILSAGKRSINPCSEADSLCIIARRFSDTSDSRALRDRQDKYIGTIRHTCSHRLASRGELDGIRLTHEHEH